MSTPTPPPTGPLLSHAGPHTESHAEQQDVLPMVPARLGDLGLGFGGGRGRPGMDKSTRHYRLIVGLSALDLCVSGIFGLVLVVMLVLPLQSDHGLMTKGILGLIVVFFGAGWFSQLGLTIWFAMRPRMLPRGLLAIAHLAVGVTGLHEMLTGDISVVVYLLAGLLHLVVGVLCLWPARLVTALRAGRSNAQTTPFVSR